MDQMTTVESASRMNTTIPITSSEQTHLLDRISFWLYVIVEPIIMVVGLVGNTLTILAVSCRKAQQTSLTIFMSSLAMADSCVLILDFLQSWLSSINLNIMGNLGFCLFHRYFFNVAYTYASWMVMAIAVERLIIVWFPLKIKTICTVKGSVITSIAMFLVLCVLYLYNLWGWTVDAIGNCDAKPFMAFFLYMIAPWLTGSFYAYIPLIVILVSSLAIIYKLTLAKYARQEMTVTDSTDDLTRKTTIMVLSVCITFLLLTVPVTAWYIIMFAKGLFLNLPRNYNLGRTIIVLIGLLNHAINFFLYGLSSSGFREDVRSVFGCNNQPSPDATACSAASGTEEGPTV